MNPLAAEIAPAPARFERTYDATVEELWELWTTKEGFEAWWGPEGFRVEVHALDCRDGGALVYDMIATDPGAIAYLEKEGRPASHGTRGTYAGVRPFETLTLVHVIDFIEEVEPYINHMTVELSEVEGGARMVVTIEPHKLPEFSRMSAQGFESQLTKVPGALAALRATS